MAQVKWTDQAIEDIANIEEFIAQDSPAFAIIQSERFFQRAEILEKQPKAGRIVPELNDSLIRELVMQNYRIIYQLDPDKVLSILTVHHSKRKLSNNPALNKE
jgi:plasmid stabilization system protein ParE